MTIVSLGGNKQLALDAGFSALAVAMGAHVWADVPLGTEGTIEITGPIHLHCPGIFMAHPKTAAFDPLPQGIPELFVGISEGISLRGPEGDYAFVATVAGYEPTARRAFRALHMTTDPISGLYAKPDGCLPVADTASEQLALIATNMSGLQRLVGALPDLSPSKAELIAEWARASRAIDAHDYKSAASALRSLITTVEANSTTDQSLVDAAGMRRAATDAVTLLEQPAPSA